MRGIEESEESEEAGKSFKDFFNTTIERTLDKKGKNIWTTDMYGNENDGSYIVTNI